MREGKREEKREGWVSEGRGGRGRVREGVREGEGGSEREGGREGGKVGCVREREGGGE